MRSLHISVAGNRKAEVMADDPPYHMNHYLHLYEDGVRVKNILYTKMYSLNEVVNQAREWTNNESKTD